jgi:PIN domain nuclease of toxin-antitoxin system
MLLDTHFLIWLVRSPETISRAERSAMADPDTELLASVISIWEVRIKWNLRDSRGRRKGEISPDEALALAADRGIELASLHPRDCAVALEPPLQHRDPFDEMLLVHARQLGAQLLTRDTRLLDHPFALQL